MQGLPIYLPGVGPTGQPVCLEQPSTKYFDNFDHQMVETLQEQSGQAKQTFFQLNHDPFLVEYLEGEESKNLQSAIARDRCNCYVKQFNTANRFAAPLPNSFAT
jgi:hypothetical protein